MTIMPETLRPPIPNWSGNRAGVVKKAEKFDDRHVPTRSDSGRIGYRDVV
jgi:hypothetical protein